MFCELTRGYLGPRAHRVGQMKGTERYQMKGTERYSFAGLAHDEHREQRVPNLANSVMSFGSVHHDRASPDRQVCPKFALLFRHGLPSSLWKPLACKKTQTRAL